MRKLSGAFGLLALGLTAVFGCSSDEKSGAAGATGGSGGRVAAGGSRAAGGTTANPAGCPATQPDQGDACTQQNLACNYANETCTCQNRGGGQAGAGGQGANLAFRCVTNPDAGAATGCADGATCTVGVDQNCTDANGDTCRCRPVGGGPDAGTTGTYRCFGGGGGAGPGTGGSANAGAAAADCVVGNQCTPGTNCTSADGFCYCQASSSTYQGGC